MVFESKGSNADEKTGNLLFTIFLCHLITEKPPRYLFQGMANKAAKPGEAQLKAGAAEFLPRHEDSSLLTVNMSPAETAAYNAKRDILGSDFQDVNFTACRNISYLCRDIECKIDVKSKSLNNKYGFRPKFFNEEKPGPFIMAAESDSENGAQMEWAAIKRIQLLEHIHAGEARADAERAIVKLFSSCC